MEKGIDIKGKVAVVAGATGLIGKALCAGLADNGAKVIVTSRDRARGTALRNELNASRKGSAVFCRLDIASEKSVGRLIERVLGKFSTIDAFINCSWPRTEDWMTDVEKVSFSSIKKNLTDHLGGYFLSTQKMALAMKARGGGSIINFSSIYGVVGPDFSIYNKTAMTCPPAYPLIKGGIITMTRYFATFFAKDGIRVNCISPGGIFNYQDSEFVKNYIRKVPLGRMGRPADITGAALFLVSDASSYITGQCLMIDGGWTAW